MSNKALVVIDLQNDITKNYREIIEAVNQAIDRAAANNVVSDHIFVKTKSSALTSEDFSAFIRERGITEFYIAGADAAACVKSTCFNMRKAGYAVHVLSDCITSYDKKKLPEMMEYYAGKGCTVARLDEVM